MRLIDIPPQHAVIFLNRTRPECFLGWTLRNGSFQSDWMYERRSAYQKITKHIATFRYNLRNGNIFGINEAYSPWNVSIRKLIEQNVRDAEYDLRAHNPTFVITG